MPRYVFIYYLKALQYFFAEYYCDELLRAMPAKAISNLTISSQSCTKNFTMSDLPPSSSPTFSKSCKVVNPTYAPILHPPTRFMSLASFYPFYLGEHSVRVCRAMHMIGTSTALGAGVYAIFCAAATLAVRLHHDLERSLPISLRPKFGTKEWLKLAIAIIIHGYAWAWVGHAFLEKNRPATFKVS